MAKLAWRFQADVAKGETDPIVTVFMGPERAVLDEDGEQTGESFIEQNTSDPVLVPLSELANAIADPAVMDEIRKRNKEEADRA